MTTKNDLIHSTNLAINNFNNNKNKFELEYIDIKSFKISPIDFNDGNSRIRLFSNDKKFDIISSEILNFKSTGLNAICDGLPFCYHNFYFLYAFFNDNNSDFIGYGLFKQPKASTYSSSTYLKGNITTIYFSGTVNSAYQFEVGARILIWASEDAVGGLYEKNNLGTIIEIKSATEMVISLDNSLHYGTSFSETAVNIIQLNKFKPKVISDSGSSLFKNNYCLLTAGLYIKMNEDYETPELQPFTYYNGTYFGYEYDVYYGGGSDSDSYNRNIFPFYCIPPTANYLIGQNRFDMYFPPSSDYNYTICEFWFRDKYNNVLYRDLYGIAPYNECYFWHQGSFFINIKELTYLYREALSIYPGNSLALRIQRIHGFMENI